MVNFVIIPQQRLRSHGTITGEILREGSTVLLTIGEPMEIHPSEADEDGIPEGESVQCSGGDGKLYRWMEGELRHYPSGAIATSWNENWKNSIQTVDCTDLPMGEPLELFEPSEVGPNLQMLRKNLI